ncbi:MAG: hypothetical protein KC589_10825 [Nanoarchaeota archaeon]|nr:hypothetical protein [Nanoarchaeota archaeon]
MEKDFDFIDLGNPVKSKKDDKIHYYDIYSKSLYNLIENNPKSLKIGLFGSYGTGKSSIIELMKKDFKSNNKLKILHFSVWGYSDLSIIRKLLLSLNSLVKLKTLKGDLFCERNIINNKEKDKNIEQYILFTSLVLSIALVIDISLYFLLKKLIIFDSLTIKIFTSLLAIGFGFYFGINTLGKITKKAPFQIDEFEDYWKKILRKIEERNIEKVVIIIDDLDRCNYKTIIKVLEKLNVLVNCSKDNKVKIKIIIPLSMNKQLDGTAFNELYDNCKKLLDSLIWIPNPSKLNLYRISKGNEK